MATSFPTGLDALTNPTSADSLASPDHAAQHANVNDAVEAIEAQIGTTASPVLARLASPTFTGTPTLPTGTIATTQTAADSSTKVATTAFVTTADNLKANLASPTFTGTPTLPTGTIATTQTAADSSTAVATTAFVASAVPLAWTSYTPTLTQGVGLAKTVNYAKYVQIRKTVFLQVVMTATGAGLGGTITVSCPSGLVPVTASDTRALGDFLIKDTGTAWYSGTAMAYATSPVTIAGLAYGSNNNMGANTPVFTVAVGDVISISVQYEVA